MSSVPPPAEWVKGQHPDHDVVCVEVLLRRDAHGRVYTEHHLQDAGDHEIVMRWPSGGLEQVAFALLAEAVRREAVLDLALQISQEPTFLDRWAAATEDERAESVGRMTDALRATVQQTVARVARAAILDALGQFVAKG